MKKEKLIQLINEVLEEEMLDEEGKKDACYHKVKARYDVWPSAYASGALVKCRKVGAANWGNKSKKEESLREEFETHDMYNPKTGEKFVAKKEEDHKAMAAKGYTHVDPKRIEKVLRDEGGASGMDPFLKEFGKEMEEEIVKTLDAMPNVGQHKDKDYILDDSKEVEIVKERKKNCGCGQDPCKTYGVQESKKKRVPRKKGQPAKSDKHSDLYTDEDPKGTIHGLGFKDETKARSSVAKIKKSNRSHAHKTQAAIAMEQRAKAAGKSKEAAIFRKFIEQQKKKTKAKNKNESMQLQEKCWPGYEKKGMKKMFGKMYPNCVKKTKKKNEDVELEEKKRKKAGTESSKESSLRDWFGRKGAKGSKKGWVDCNAPDGKGGYKSCGRSGGEKRKRYPSCRPTPGACKEKGKGKSWGKKGAKKKNEVLDMRKGLLYEGDESILEMFEGATLEDGTLVCEACLFETLQEASCGCPDLVMEAEYQGRKVTLNKPMRGDVKKFKVYVKDPKTGNIKKVNFGHGGTSAKAKGEKTMKIRKGNPKARKSFRARHNCDNPGPKTKARYWSCKKW